MKRVLAGAVLLFVAACSESPTQLPSNLQPQLATVVGTGATWYFEGTVSMVSGPSTAVLGQVVKGTMTFKITTDDVMPEDPCRGYYYVESSFKFTVDGVPVVLPTSNGEAISYPSCAFGHPWVQVNTHQDNNSKTWQIEVANPADNEDFPLMPPVLGGWPNIMSWWNNSGEYVRVTLTKLFGTPQTKAECKNDGWKNFGFRNQGLCVSYFETGKDTR